MLGKWFNLLIIHRVLVGNSLLKWLTLKARLISSSYNSQKIAQIFGMKNRFEKKQKAHSLSQMTSEDHGIRPHCNMQHANFHLASAQPTNKQPVQIDFTNPADLAFV
ncbi:hypothetical protein L6164_035411 [Bauhinia variegata]|uniref:Uncharacterized protein n=1 Tax=Bauhinia variegata TaxID=167791 RepID=A0ACB9KDV8_BAUVA|nr:hypothetical protein L6164_035411 [Bauhinia variegata]